MKRKKIAVVGGAGYVGSFTSRALADAGHDVVVIDDLSAGHKEAIGNLRIEKIDIVDQKNVLNNFFEKEKFDSVIHFAALLHVGESMQEPGLYFHHNVDGSVNVIEAAFKGGVKKFVFSSTAAVYGDPQKIPIPEDYRLQPASVYGETKAMVERILEWYGKLFNLSSVSIRYFNASGAGKDGSIGEDHPREPHLIPKVINSILGGGEVTIFGKDYDTQDGTCIRDYIHVIDLADIHIRALEYLNENKGNFKFNAGTGHGYSNLEVIKMVEKVSKKKVSYSFGPRRAGDPAQLVADASLAKNKLGWSPSHSSLEKVIKSAWRWHSRHPNGY